MFHIVTLEDYVHNVNIQPVKTETKHSYSTVSQPALATNSSWCQSAREVRCARELCFNIQAGVGARELSQTGLQSSTPACHTSASSPPWISSAHRSRMVQCHTTAPPTWSELSPWQSSHRHLRHTETHTHSHTHTLTHSLTHKHTLFHRHSLTHTHTQSYTHTHTVSQTHTDTHILSHTSTPSLSQTLTNRFAIPEYSVRSNSVRR